MELLERAAASGVLDAGVGGLPSRGAVVLVALVASTVSPPVRIGASPNEVVIDRAQALAG